MSFRGEPLSCEPFSANLRRANLCPARLCRRTRVAIVLRRQFRPAAQCALWAYSSTHWWFCVPLTYVRNKIQLLYHYMMSSCLEIHGNVVAARFVTKVSPLLQMAIIHDNALHKLTHSGRPWRRTGMWWRRRSSDPRRAQWQGREGA